MINNLVVFRVFILPVEMDDLQDTTMHEETKDLMIDRKINSPTRSRDLLGSTRSLWWWTWHVMLQCGVPSWAFWETNGAAANVNWRVRGYSLFQKNYDLQAARVNGIFDFNGCYSVCTDLEF